MGPRWVLAAMLALAGCAATPIPSGEAAPVAAACPEGLPAGAKCLRGRDSNQAHYLIVMPAQWNRVLVVHAHGGPALGKPEMARANEDAKRWSITVKAGYAWASSAFRQGGVAARSAAEDTEIVRRIFVEHVAVPRRTILHGQSWGASVAAKTAEKYAAAAGSPYDGVLLTSGVIGGGNGSYAFRLDLRVAYQYLCNNHPRADEPQYPLWMGLPKESKLTRAQLAARVDECLGVGRPPAQRTPEQARKLKTIVDVIRIPESSVLAHLNWGTWHFQDIVLNRTGGRNPFDNQAREYRGSPDDAALNAGVARYPPDPIAAAQLAEDMDPTGRIGVPVLTAHAIGDPTAFVELEDTFRRTMEAGGSSARLVQAFTDHKEHSYLADPVYPTLFAALLRWIDTGEKPTDASIAQQCTSMEATYGPGCGFQPGYRPAPMAARIAPRRDLP